MLKRFRIVSYLVDFCFQMVLIRSKWRLFRAQPQRVYHEASNEEFFIVCRRFQLAKNREK